MTGKKPTLDECLDDLCVRFIINLPLEELESVQRICFQIEEAQWNYEDFWRAVWPYLPSFNLKDFSLLVFQHCPLFSGTSREDHLAAFSEFLAYKKRVPVRGAIMLNEAMDEVVLVKGWKKNANWSFPRGKINQDEKDLDCAVREVYEETGFDIRTAGLIQDVASTKFIDITMREQQMRLYVFRDVPMDTHFEPRTRKEISKIQWYKLSELPTLKRSSQQQEGRDHDLAANANKFYMVAPFLAPLKKWITQQKKQDALKATYSKQSQTTSTSEKLDNHEEIHKPDDMTRLVASLRKSGQVPTISDLPELSNPVVSGEDPSSQFKRVLLSSGESEYRNGTTISSSAEATKSKALLALLRGESNPSADGNDQLVQPPHTPSDQILEHPPLPRSPHYHHQLSQAQQLSGPPPPLALPSNLDQVRDLNMPSTQPPSLPSNQIPITMPQSARRVKPQYQKMGGRHFSPSSQVSNVRTSLIPPANKLPPPKLTTHSSALLDIFKTGKMVKRLPETPIKSPYNSHEPAAIISSTEAPNTGKRQGHVTIDGGLLPRDLLATRNPILEQESTTLPLADLLPKQDSRPRSSHQNNLLSLFRSPPATIAATTQSPTSTLEPPSALVELSAQPTPGHSRNSSYLTETTSHLLPKANPTTSGHTKIRQRPLVKANIAPVSATVTGPLNDPQFEKTHQRIRKAIFVNGTVDKPRIDEVRSSPAITILPRPQTLPKPTDVSQSDYSQKTTQTTTRKFIPAPKITTTNTTSSKTFQPQILRRPAEIQPLPRVPVTSRAVSQSTDGHDRFFLDRSTDQPKEHKQALLSLFRQPNLAAASTSTDRGIISPLPELPLRKESMVSMPLELTSSQFGIVNSGVGEGTVKLNSGEQTPKTAPIDKSFLLKYLDEIASEAGK